MEQSYNWIMKGNEKGRNGLARDGLNQLIDSAKYQLPALKCKHGHQIQRICIAPSCQQSAFTCIICNQNDHPSCPSLPATQFNLLLRKNQSHKKTIVSHIYQMQSDLIDLIIKNQETEVKDGMHFGGDEEQRQIWGRLIRKEMGCKGSEMKRFTQKLSLFNSNIDSIQNIVKKKLESIYSAVEQLLKQKIAHSLKNIHGLSSSLIDNMEQSFLIKHSLEQIQQVHSFQLLFRASEHKFSAAQFHRKCDNIERTLTIIRTQFGKTIAAYTPLPWNQHTQELMPDPSNTSFLLQLDLKQKMSLLQPQNAVYNHPNYGPTFGSGHDICIEDNCNTNDNNRANFPFSYNCKEKPWTNNQLSYCLFSGAENGCKFKVTEYQVFRVIFQSGQAVRKLMDKVGQQDSKCNVM